MEKPYAISLYRKKDADGQWKVLGWRVIMNRRGITVDRKFTLKDYGDTDAALQAAKDFRDELHRDYAPLTKREMCATVRSSNTSGVPGVQRVFDSGSPSWKACLIDANGRMHSKQFSTSKYGEDAAFQLAVKARLQLLATVTGYVVYHPEVRDEMRALPECACEVLRQPNKIEPAEHPYPYRPESDIPGVGVTNVKSVDSNNKIYTTRYWTSTIRNESGLPKRRYFSVIKYGEEEAMRLAVEDQRQRLKPAQ